MSHLSTSTLAPRRNRTFSRAAVGVLAGLVLLTLGGCYQRTVSARGIGAANQEVSESYQESGQLDDWIFGPTNSSKPQTPMSRNSSRLR